MTPEQALRTVDEALTIDGLTLPATVVEEVTAAALNVIDDLVTRDTAIDDLVTRLDLTRRTAAKRLDLAVEALTAQE